MICKSQWIPTPFPLRGTTHKICTQLLQLTTKANYSGSPIMTRATAINLLTQIQEMWAGHGRMTKACSHRNDGVFVLIGPQDRLLRDAVEKYGDHDNWKAIAEKIPGRSNKACRKVNTTTSFFYASMNETPVLEALASFFVTDSEKICVDEHRGSTAYRLISNSWAQVVYYCSSYSREDR